MKAVVAAFNQEKALVGAFSVITNLRMELFEARVPARSSPAHTAAVLGHTRLCTLLAVCVAWLETRYTAAEMFYKILQFTKH